MSGLEWDEASRGSFGGTEVMAREPGRRLPGDLLERFQIVTSQVKTLAPGKIRVFWCHCTPYARPAAYLANGGWRNFHRIVFVSNWQAQAFISTFGIPWSRCQVMLNAIEPIAVSGDRLIPVPAGTPVRLACTPVPHRGPGILHAVFGLAAQKAYADFHYGWDRRMALWEPFLRSIAGIALDG
jgi:hypothetical protein